MGHHFYTTNPVEALQATTKGYAFEGVVCYVGSAATDQVRDEFYRLYQQSSNDHFYTPDAGERDNAERILGYMGEGNAGFVSIAQRGGLVQLYRLVGRAGDHFYTADASEVKQILGDYTQEQIYWAYPSDQAKPDGATELYRLSTRD